MALSVLPLVSLAVRDHARAVLLVQLREHWHADIAGQVAAAEAAAQAFVAVREQLAATQFSAGPAERDRAPCRVFHKFLQSRPGSPKYRQSTRQARE